MKRMPHRIVKSHLIKTPSRGLCRCVYTERNAQAKRWEINEGICLPLVGVVIPIRGLDSFKKISDAFDFLNNNEYAEYFTPRR